MEKKDYYELREIIFGLRSEYLKNKEKLRILRTLCTSHDKRVKDFLFSVWQETGMNPELICEFIQNENKLCSKLKELMRLQVIGKTSTICTKDNNDRYYIMNPNYNASIIAGLEKEFNLLVKEILNSDFIKNIKINELSSGISFNDSKVHASLRTTQELIDFSIYKESSFFDTFSSFYISNSDIISILSQRGRISPSQLENIFSIKFSKANFSKYHQEVIESNKSSQKNIVFEDSDINRIRTDFSIEEYEKEFVLKKIK